jgi:hypothetical protein
MPTLPRLGSAVLDGALARDGTLSAGLVGDGPAVLAIRCCAARIASEIRLAFSFTRSTKQRNVPPGCRAMMPQYFFSVGLAAVKDTYWSEVL